MKAIINGKIIMEESIMEDQAIVFDNKIIDIIDKEQLKEDLNLDLIDVGGRYVAPGFIDLHIHGAGGRDTMDASIEALTDISSIILETGVTAFLPTTMTMDKENIYQALNIIRDSMDSNLQGAKILGAHLEGPFINKKYKGAQDAKYIQKPSYEFIKDYLDIIKIITLAPEVDQGYGFISKMKEHDIVLSMGHSNATYEEAMEAIKRGISHATHIFNAMTPLHHREPGVVGSVFASNITCELIADKIHVHPGIFQMLVDIKGEDRVVLISDSMRAACMRDGVYDLGGQQVRVKDGSARLTDNTLAGSVLTLNQALKNIIEHTELSLIDAIKMVTLNQAKLIGIDKYKGSIKKGKDADVVVFDKEVNISLTIVEGEILYRKL
ncbi:N-acetylglucosamine-6-phosphate deacetylase [Orenia metallireducens]|uniref:N-acetylglucosamine-6-phosphate deacetylase n=1 Tax=Orenia metallireducens TaxID=1413210 RepID=A0A285GGQ9_9FIRM|nr:N-acetylglucosamine-6-phosphate deacetylase [Orenia metallireducens]PRX30473.1 N-acetylglucosamine-6-phosphate deacetylase [Orenia metallireducens]SNY22749.1 N-acetylglucosamine-6-phosphate deacetylase [Orenia metallireducens]